jgi:hypothetical protein
MTVRGGADVTPHTHRQVEHEHTGEPWHAHVLATPPSEEATGLRELLREAIEVVHQIGSLRDHADPNDKTGWNVHGIETCQDPLCVDALAALASTERTEP